jgi:iron complex outermembrane receptor protein
MAMAAAAAPVAAQRPDTARTDTARVVLPVITVGATRESQSLMAVSLAVTRLDSTALLGAKGLGLDAALSQVPGVLAQSRSGGTDVRIVIRGFGARGAGDRSNAGTSRGIRVLVDGVPETEPDGRTAFDNVDLAATQGIEVIRSNASALWGNAAGGVISISTLPEVRTLQWSADALRGGFGLSRYIARIAGPLGGGTIGATFVQTDYDGWRRHSGGSRSLVNLAARTVVGGATRLGVYMVASHNRFDVPGPLTQAQVDADPVQANATYFQRRERRDNRVGRLAVAIEHRPSAATELSGMVFASPKFLQRSERGTFRDFTRYHLGGSVLARHAFPVGGAVGAVLAGADEAYQDGAILFYALTAEGDRDDSLVTDKREGAENRGAFVQAELGWERVTLTAGARYDAITYYAEDHLRPALDARRTFARLTPKVGLTWRVGRGHALYANVGGGVEAPAGNETDPASTFGQDTITALNPLLEPIRSTTVEVGARRIVAGGGLVQVLSYDLALYTTGVANEIVPYRGGRFYFTAGRVRRSGAELGLTAHLAGGIQLQGAFTWSRNRYQRYLVDSVHYGVPGALADYSGNRVVGVPDVIASGGIKHAPPALAPVFARLSLQGASRYYADDANIVTVPGYAVLNLTFGLERPVGVGAGLGAQGFVTVDNLLDRRYIASAFLNPDVVGGVPVAFEPGLPRHLVVSIGISRR